MAAVGAVALASRRPSIVTVSGQPAYATVLEMLLERLDAPCLFPLLLGLLVEMRLLLLPFVQEQDVQRFLVHRLRLSRSPSISCLNTDGRFL